MTAPIYGITPTFADAWLSSLNGARTNIPAVYAGLHSGDPGPLGVDNQASDTALKQLAFTSPSDDASTSLAGGVPTWNITANELLAAVSLWNGVGGDAVCMFTLQVSPPTKVAPGDVVILGACDLQWQPAAAGIWPPTQTIAVPVAHATASMFIPNISVFPIRVPVMSATASAHVPTVTAITAIPVPLMSATASAHAPTVTGTATITVPVMLGSATALLPTVIVGNGPRYVPQRQLHVAVMRASTM